MKAHPNQLHPPLPQGRSLLAQLLIALYFFGSLNYGLVTLTHELSHLAGQTLQRYADDGQNDQRHFHPEGDDLSNHSHGAMMALAHKLADGNSEKGAQNRTIVKLEVLFLHLSTQPPVADRPPAEHRLQTIYFQNLKPVQTEPFLPPPQARSASRNLA